MTLDDVKKFEAQLRVLLSATTPTYAMEYIYYKRFAESMASVSNGHARLYDREYILDFIGTQHQHITMDYMMWLCIDGTSWNMKAAESLLANNPTIRGLYETP